MPILGGLSKNYLTRGATRRTRLDVKYGPVGYYKGSGTGSMGSRIGDTILPDPLKIRWFVAPNRPNPDLKPYPTQDPTLERCFQGHKDTITSLSFKCDMKQLASGSLDNSLMLWNFKPQMRAFKLAGHKGPVLDVDFSPSGRIVASASRDSTVRLWTPNVNGSVTTVKAHSGAVRCVKFSPLEDVFLTTSDDKSIKFKFSLNGHVNWVRTAAFARPDGRLIASGGDDKLVKLWDVSQKECVHSFADHQGIINSVAIHPAGTLIASSSTDKSIKVWDIRTHRLFQHYKAHHDTVNQIAFHPSGNYIFSTSNDGLIKIWDAVEGHLFYTLHGHRGPTTAITCSDDGEFFSTAGTDNQVLVWKTNFDTDSPVVPIGKGEETLDSIEISAPIITEKIYQSERYNDESPVEQTEILQVKTIPDDIALTMKHILEQLHILTQSVSLMEQRLSINEDKINSLQKHFDKAGK